jgi:hypothetical protein
MKHHELQDKIYWHWRYVQGNDGLQALTDYRRTILAVMELHKPIEEDGKLWCRHEVCYNHIEFLERNDCYCSYPCPTIQAIEEQLK